MGPMGSGPMAVKVNEIMKSRVVTATPHQTVGHVRDLFSRNKIGIIPVTGPDKEVLGVVSPTDVLAHKKDATPVSTLMTEKIYSVPLYADVELAARMMIKHHIHHIIVVHEKKLAGVLSSFDLLQLVEGKRFVMKNPPTPSKKAGK